jgi:hypothetical protein
LVNNYVRDQVNIFGLQIPLKFEKMKTLLVIL